VTHTDSSAAVYALLEEITLRPRSDFRSGVRLGQGLQIRREVYTLWLIPGLEQLLGIHPSRLEWDSVDTVQDLISLAEAHVLRGQFLASKQ
jgi:hypothetical protein